MQAKNFLKTDQKEKLQKALKENGHPDIRERICQKRKFRNVL